MVKDVSDRLRDLCFKVVYLKHIVRHKLIVHTLYLDKLMTHARNPELGRNHEFAT